VRREEEIADAGSLMPSFLLLGDVARHTAPFSSVALLALPTPSSQREMGQRPTDEGGKSVVGDGSRDGVIGPDEGMAVTQGRIEVRVGEPVGRERAREGK